MKAFNVIWWDFNKKEPEAYDIMPFLLDEYERKPRKYKPKITDRAAVTQFVRQYALYQWWGRCQYEIIISNWPTQDLSVKWDIHKQIIMNLDIIVDILIENIKERNKSRRQKKLNIKHGY